MTIDVVDVPALDDLTAVDPPFAPTIMGLFRGFPLNETGADPGEAGGLYGRHIDTIPTRSDRNNSRAILLYRNNLMRAAQTLEELRLQIRKTVAHEIGHLRGLDEVDLRRRGLE